MTGCDKISDMLCDYLNGRLSRDERSLFITHLAGCRDCRAETAALIEIRDAEQNRLTDVPQDILNTAFDKIPSGMTAGELYAFAFDTVYFSMKLIRQTMTLALRAI